MAAGDTESGTISCEAGDASVDPGASLLTAMAAELDALYADVRGSLDAIPATPGQMAPPGGCFLIARRGGAAVGCGGLKRFDTRTAEVKRMYVVPAARGLGVGVAILEALEQAALDLGYATVRLDTGPRQPWAKRIYEAAGYREIADYNGNPYAAHWFEKEISGSGRAGRPTREPD